MTSLVQSLNRKIVSQSSYYGNGNFSGALQARVFLSLCAPTLLFLMSSFQQVIRTPEQVSHWYVSSHAELMQEEWTPTTNVFICFKEEMKWELREAQRTGWEIWKSFKAVFSPLLPLLIGSWSRRKSCRPNQMAECCCQKLLIHCFPPLAAFLRVSGTFLPLLSSSLSISITNFNFLWPIPLSICFFCIPRREEEGALAFQLFICKYFLYFCPDLAIFGALQEQGNRVTSIPCSFIPG